MSDALNIPPSTLEDLGIDPDEDNCSICLQTYIDRTILPTCSHEFCFECILIWTNQSRKCPLCAQTIGNYLMHNFRDRYDHQKHYLVPLREPPTEGEPSRIQARQFIRRLQRRTPREFGRRDEPLSEEDALEKAIAKRKWVYEKNAYVKHIASNSHTKFRPFPTPSQFASNPELISRANTFLRRELRVWNNLDIEFLTSFVVSLMKSIDIRTESAVKLLAEFLDSDTGYVEGSRCLNAEHLAHELYSYLRSPFKDLSVYDSVAQYQTPTEQDVSISSSESRHLPHPTSDEALAERGDFHSQNTITSSRASSVVHEDTKIRTPSTLRSTKGKEKAHAPDIKIRGAATMAIESQSRYRRASLLERLQQEKEEASSGA